MARSLNEPTVHKKNFLDFFPAPGFLLLSTVGMALSDTSIVLIEFKQSGKAGELVLAEWGEQALQPGTIGAGHILDKDALVKALTELREKHHFRYVRATLPEEKAYLFTVEVEKEPFASLRDRVAFTIEENVPVSLVESIFDFDIIGDTEGKPKIKVAVSVLPIKEVSAYIEAFQEAGITPISCDVESQSIAKAIIPTGDTRPHLIMNLGEEKTGLYVVEDEVVQFSSTPPYGVRKSDAGYTDVAGLKAEMRKLFAFWNTRLSTVGVPEKRIEKIFITGSGAKADDFISELMDGIEIEYSLANVWVNAFSFKQYLPEISFNDSLSYAGAIGRALPNKEPRYV